VTAGPSERTVTSSARSLSNAAGGGGPKTTDVDAAPSHTVQPASCVGAADPTAAGAPGMPTCGPRRASARVRALTARGSAGLPTIRRAEARLGTGCSVSSIRT